MSLRRDYFDWKLKHITSAGMEDAMFFQERYGAMMIHPMLREMFNEMIELSNEVTALKYETDDKE